MKHFKLTGPKTSRDFDIGDDEMVIIEIVKIKDWESGYIRNSFSEYSQKMQNEVITENA